MNTVKIKLTFLLAVLVSFISFTSAQAPKPKPKPAAPAQLSNAEKMGYARTNQYWGPGTYYAFAPGTPKNKMVNNSESAMRDLTGISKEDFMTEITKQGYAEVPAKEVKKWFAEGRSKDVKYYYSPDKSFILIPGIIDMYNSAKAGYMPYATDGMMRYMLFPVQDSVKVMNLVWKFVGDMYDMKVLLSSFGSDFSKSNPKTYPIERCGSSGWSSMRAGTFVLLNVDGKMKGYWETNEAIVRRTMGKPGFKLRILGTETDFGYGLEVKLTKEGYVLIYNTIAMTMRNLEPGGNWIDEHKTLVESMRLGEEGDKKAIELYKNAPMPPVLMDINKLLHR
jgi:hypothetical protein